MGKLSSTSITQCDEEGAACWPQGMEQGRSAQQAGPEQLSQELQDFGIPGTADGLSHSTTDAVMCQGNAKSQLQLPHHSNIHIP